MSMTADQAKAIADYTLADFAGERDITKRVIGAIPATGLAYTPDAKSMNSLDLAWHIASAELFFLNGVCDGTFAGGEGKRPEGVNTPQDVVAWYDEHIPAALTRAQGLSGEQLMQVIDFFGIFKAPGVAYLTLMVKHGAHHRGQLSAYLRPMGAKVPGIYGPSADTQEAASA